MMKIKIILAATVLFMLQQVKISAQVAGLDGGQMGAVTQEIPVYKNPAKPVEQRVADLLGRMTLEEKVAQLRHLHFGQLYTGQEMDLEKVRKSVGDISYGCSEGFWLTSAGARKAFRAVQQYMVENTRLGIPIITVTESIHGTLHSGSTIFPQSVAVGSSFNIDLAYRMTKTIAAELRSLGVVQTLSPGLDVVRDLRWGRVEESFGEDPWLVGKMSIAEVNGYIDGGVAPMLKPFGPGGAPLGGLNLASVESGERDVRLIHLKPYEMAVKNTDVKAVMSSYMSWNHIPNSASHFLLTELLRDEWGFKGYVYSDWGAVSMLVNFQRTAKDCAEAAMQALLAGLDLEASSGCYGSLVSLVKSGQLDEKHVDRAVERILRVKFELGLFENPYPSDNMPASVLHSDEAVALSREVADESIVLLKNENNILPLNIDNIRSLAVIGHNAGQVQFGGYSWGGLNEHGVTPVDGIKKLVGDKVKVNYAKGCDLVTSDTSGFAAAFAAAQASELSIVFVGSSSPSLSRDNSNVTVGEGYDLSSIELTGVQGDLVKRIYAAGKPVVLVLVTGKPFAIPWEKEHLPAIAVQWYGGERAGDAIADMLFGKTNPSARLPFSFPQSTGHLPVFYNHLPTDKGFYHQPGSPNKPGRDYVFATPAPLWAFGHGLSYTSFEYLDMEVSPSGQLNPFDTLTVKVTLKNSGARAGKEVVQLYFRDVVSSMVTPVKQLKGFAKPFLNAGETKTVEMRVPVQEFALYDINMKRIVEEGDFELQVGGASDDIKLKKTVYVGSAQVAAAKSDDAKATGQQADIAKNPGKAITVKGTVRDIQATPVAGALIKSIYSGKTATSDKNGRYSIASVENDMLTVSAKGFETLNIDVNKTKNIDVKLEYIHE